MPCLSAKLTAARVGAPPASYATDFGGPVTSVVTSVCRNGRPRAHSTRRLGVLNASTVTPSAILSTASCFSRPDRSSSVARASIPAGISSQPTSKSSSSFLSATALEPDFAAGILAPTLGFTGLIPAPRPQQPSAAPDKPQPSDKQRHEPGPSALHAP